MTHHLQSYDERGPLIYLGPVAMWLIHDPLWIGRNERYDFTLDLWQLWQTESQFSVMAGDQTIKTGSTFNDYYGFGSSRVSALEEASDYQGKLAGAAVDVIVTTTLTARPVVHDANTPVFYNRCVRCFHIPEWRWRVGEDQAVAKAYGQGHDFVIWKNGCVTEAGEALQSQIDSIRAQDGASAIRKETT